MARIGNNRVNVPRDTLRRFRALPHQIEKTGPEGKRWGKGGNVLVAALGFAHFVRMVDAEAGAALVAKVEALAGRHGVVGPQRFTLPAFRGKAAHGEQPLERWWQPAPRAIPKPEPVLAAHLQEQQEARDGANGAARPSTFDVLGGRSRPAGASQPRAGASGPRSAASGPRTAEAPPPRAAQTPRQPWFSKRWWNILIWVGLAATLVRLPWPLALCLVVVGAIAFLAIRAWGRR